VVVTEIGASKDSTKAPDADAMAVQLARRDLNVVPSLLPCKPLIKSLLASDFFCQMLQGVTMISCDLTHIMHLFTESTTHPC